tara:strand:- start:2526 stop:2750 length:225 start_codon:yes stop_codon:yes gene_type:complete
MNSFYNNWKLIIIGCLTLGMAPFFPEPHIWGKVKWVAGGATGMTFKDWFDILLHGLPFILLIRIAGVKIISFIK